MFRFFFLTDFNEVSFLSAIPQDSALLPIHPLVPEQLQVDPSGYQIPVEQQLGFEPAPLDPLVLQQFLALDPASQFKVLASDVVLQQQFLTLDPELQQEILNQNPLLQKQPDTPLEDALAFGQQFVPVPQDQQNIEGLVLQDQIGPGHTQQQEFISQDFLQQFFSQDPEVQQQILNQNPELQQILQDPSLLQEQVQLQDPNLFQGQVQLQQFQDPSLQQQQFLLDPNLQGQLLFEDPNLQQDQLQFQQLQAQDLTYQQLLSQNPNLDPNFLPQVQDPNLNFPQGLSPVPQDYPAVSQLPLLPVVSQLPPHPQIPSDQPDLQIVSQLPLIPHNHPEVSQLPPLHHSIQLQPLLPDVHKHSPDYIATTPLPNPEDISVLHPISAYGNIYPPGIKKIGCFGILVRLHFN